MPILKKFIPFFVAVFLFSTLLPNFASAIGNGDKGLNGSDHEKLLDEEMFEQSTSVLQAIEDIPEGIIDQGAYETAEWLHKKTGLFVHVDYVDGEEYLRFSEVDGTAIRPANVMGCITAVGIAIVSNAFSFTKITKIKSALKAMGGTAKAVKEIKKWYDKYRYGGFSRHKAISKALDKASSGLSKDVKNALLDFFSLTNVVANCF